ncbi:alpha/beta hydrolase [Leifsonia poae]|uniref:alpha/beta hydrolase n=1 Tax=Leifsonia poae TaxID=110933 RepID=UPI001CBFF524|nr:alpha/beta-hydrolase family protein [Leifsonia poae]
MCRPAHSEGSRIRRLSLPRWLHLDFGGLIIGGFVLALTLTPSLVPRPALFQGLIAGIGFGLGYAVGAGLFWIVRRAIPWRPSRRTVVIVWWVFWVAAAAGALWLRFAAVAWQNDVRRLVEMPPIDAADYATYFAVSLVVSVAAIALGRAVARLFRWLRRLISALLTRRSGEAVPPRSVRIGSTAASLLATALVIALVCSGVGALGMFAVDRVYSARNDVVQTDVREPASTYRSAGPGSAVAWNALGSQGRAFVGGGPTAEQISALTGEPAVTPIRVYVGMTERVSLEARAALAVQELVRTGAFDRRVLVVATTTGSGWLEPQAMDALEYLQGGDTAIVSMQYAYTPSWVSFVFDQELPVAASKALFDAVHAKWAALPSGHRPQLIAYGLSLGAHGMQSVFTSLADVRTRTDGALFVGSPNGTPLWNELQDARTPGSPAWQPVLDDGAEVRWLSSRGDFDRLPGPWTAPRVAYLQHASDPVTWLGPSLLWSEPDWLKPGKRGPDISSDMRWIPLVTGAQVLVDMLLGESVPARHGHNYGDVILDAWVAVSRPTELSDAALARVQAKLESYATDSPISE